LPGIFSLLVARSFVDGDRTTLGRDENVSAVKSSFIAGIYLFRIYSEYYSEFNHWIYSE